MKKVAIFVFNHEKMCFMHVLLYALELNKKNYEVKLIIEGMATKTIKELYEDGKSHLAKKYLEVKEKNLIEGVCLACSKATGSYEDLKKQNLKFLDELEGHPSLENYISQNYEIISF
jgi:hypothetical protein